MVNLIKIVPLFWWAVSTLTILLIILMLITWLLFRRMKRFESSFISLQTFMSGRQLESLLQDYSQKAAEQDQELKEYKGRLLKIEEKLRASVDRAELIRFRAFENVGSDLSFALAMLNQEGNGVVISAIQSRDDTRVYAKPISNGNSTYVLSNEEKEVITKAMQGEKL